MRERRALLHHGVVAGLLSAAGALALGAGTVLAAPKPPGRGTWLELATPHFVVVSNARAARVTELAGELERFVATLAQIVPPSRARGTKVPVFLFDAREDFVEACRPLQGPGCDGLAGLYTRGVLGPVILADATNLERARAIAFHEMTHAMVQRASPGTPLWLEEGLAELYSTFKVAGGTVSVGHPLAHHLVTFEQRGLLPLPTLLGADMDSEVYDADAERPRFYATSWLLTHYLVVGAQQRRGQLSRFMAEVQREQPPATAFTTAFACEPAALEAELRRYAGGASMPHLELEASALEAPPLADPEVLARDEALAWLAVVPIEAGTDGATAATAILTEALRANPDSVRATALRGWALTRLGRVDEAVPLLERALQLAPPSAETLALLALALMEQAAPSRAGAAPTVEAASLARPRKLLAWALRTEPENLPALVALGRSYVISSGADLEPGIAALGKALELAPDDADAAFNLAQLLARSASFDRAESVVARHLATSSDPAVRSRGRAARAQILVARARLLDREGKHALAVRALETALEATREPALREFLTAEIGALRQAYTVRSLIERVAVMSPSAAVAACDEALATLTVPALRSQVIELRASLRTAPPTVPAARPLLLPSTLAPPPAGSPPSGSPTPGRAGSRPRSIAEEAELLNRATALFDAGDTAGALAIADDLARSATNPTIRAAAADYAARVRAGQVTRRTTPKR